MDVDGTKRKSKKKTRITCKLYCNYNTISMYKRWVCTCKKELKLVWLELRLRGTETIFSLFSPLSHFLSLMYLFFSLFLVNEKTRLELLIKPFMVVYKFYIFPLLSLSLYIALG